MIPDGLDGSAAQMKVMTFPRSHLRFIAKKSCYDPDFAEAYRQEAYRQEVNPISEMLSGLQVTTRMNSGAFKLSNPHLPISFIHSRNRL